MSAPAAVVAPFATVVAGELALLEDVTLETLALTTARTHARLATAALAEGLPLRAEGHMSLAAAYLMRAEVLRAAEAEGGEG